MVSYAWGTAFVTGPSRCGILKNISQGPLEHAPFPSMETVHASEDLGKLKRTVFVAMEPWPRTQYALVALLPFDVFSCGLISSYPSLSSHMKVHQKEEVQEMYVDIHFFCQLGGYADKRMVTGMKTPVLLICPTGWENFYSSKALVLLTDSIPQYIHICRKNSTSRAVLVGERRSWKNHLQNRLRLQGTACSVISESSATLEVSGTHF